MPSFAIESALYKIRKANGLKADERDYKENYADYDQDDCGTTNIIIKGDKSKHNKKKIKKLKNKIKALESEVAILNIKLNEKPKIIIMDKLNSTEQIKSDKT